MFGFNANIILNINDFYEFNSLRKNQLLRFYAEVEPIIGDCMDAIQKAKGATKYRDYCKFWYDGCWNCKKASNLFFRAQYSQTDSSLTLLLPSFITVASFVLQILWDSMKLDKKSWLTSITTCLWSIIVRCSMLIVAWYRVSMAWINYYWSTYSL